MKLEGRYFKPNPRVAIFNTYHYGYERIVTYKFK